MATVIDTLITEFAFREDTAGLRRAQTTVDRFGQRANRVLAGIGRGVALGGAAIIGLGTAAFFTGSPTERELLKLQTQLGLTAADVAAIRPELRDLSEDTARPLEDLTLAYFNARSAGLDHAAALDTVTNSARASTGQLGSVAQITKLASTLQNAYKGEIAGSVEITDKLTAAVRVGFLSADEFVGAFGRLLQVAPALGIEYDELAGILAAGSKTFPEASELTTQLQRTMFGLLSPTAQAKTRLEKLGITTDELRRKAGEDGLIATLRWLWQEIGENNDVLRELFESQEAQALILDIVNNRSEEYVDVTRQVQTSVGDTNRSFEAWADSGLSKVERGTNDGKLALEDLYQNAVIPVLNKFGEMPDALQNVVVAMALLSGASFVLGGPRALGLLGGVAGGLISLFGFLLSPIGLLILALAAAGIAGWLFRDEISAASQQAHDAVAEHSENLGVRARDLWDQVSQEVGGFFDAAGTTARTSWDNTSRWFWQQIETVFGPGVEERWNEITAGMGEAFDEFGTQVRRQWDQVVDYINENGPRLVARPGLEGVATVAAAIQQGRPDVIQDLNRSLPEATGGVVSGSFLLDALGGFLQGFVGGPNDDLAAAAVPSGAVVQDNRQFTVSEGAVQVLGAVGQSAEETGRATARAMRDEFEAIPAAFDTDVLR